MGHPLHIPFGSAAGEGGNKTGNTAEVVVVTPQSAGWSYSGLKVIELAAGETWESSTGSSEVLVLPLSGSCTVECEEERFELTGRRDVFAAVSDFAYVPIDSKIRISSGAGGRFALPGALATRRLEPRYGAAQEVPVELRGAGHATRQLNNFCDPQSFETDKVVAVECITPSGNWSSWPPHKHDEHRPGEAILEEIYYFETAKAVGKAGGGGSEGGDGREMGEGFALHRLYTKDGEIDLCEEVRHRDVVLIPRGYHGPSMTAPGYDLYYLNVLAGPAPERAMSFCDDPSHHWIRQSWKGMSTDPRLPMTSADGVTGAGR